MQAIFGLVARKGRFVLVLGLLAGLALPEVAQSLRPWLGELILLLLFLSAFRVGFPATLNGLKRSGRTLGIVLSYQLVMPVLCILTFSLVGQAHSPAAIALTLMLAAPSVTGSPNLAVLLGHSPEPAFRLLILGTLILPFTLIPVFWLSPALGSMDEAIISALKLGGAVGVTVALAFLTRSALRSDMKADEVQAVDGLTTLVLAIIVVGLMSAVVPAFTADVNGLGLWLLLALTANLGLQVVSNLILRRSGEAEHAAPMAVVAGNRNVALFLVTSNTIETDSFLVFLGCYQIPMYLTPYLMRPLLGRQT